MSPKTSLGVGPCLKISLAHLPSAQAGLSIWQHLRAGASGDVSLLNEEQNNNLFLFPLFLAHLCRLPTSAVFGKVCGLGFHTFPAPVPSVRAPTFTLAGPMLFSILRAWDQPLLFTPFFLNFLPLWFASVALLQIGRKSKHPETSKTFTNSGFLSTHYHYSMMIIIFLQH